MGRRFRYTDHLLLILTIFTVTFFVYRDFGIRMLFGFGALVLALLLHLLRRLKADRPLTAVSLQLPYLWLCLVILLNFLRPDARHDADSTAYILSMLVCCAVLLLASPDDREGQRCLDILLWAGLLMALFVIFFSVFEDLYQDTLYHILTPTARDYLTYFLPQGYAVTLGGCTYTCYILFFGLAVCAASIYSSPKWTRRSTFLLLCYGLILLAMVLVGRRGELLGALFCSALLFLVMCPPRRRMQVIFGGILALAVTLCLMILFLPELKQIGFLQRYIATLENLLSGQDVTTGRLTLYRNALDAFWSKPIFGIGWDQFYKMVPGHYTTNPVVTIEDVHCIYLQFFCETGIVSAPLIIAPLFYYYYLICALLRQLMPRRTESPELGRIFAMCVTSFLIQTFILFVGIYDPNFQRIIFWCFYVLALILGNGALICSGWRPTDPVSHWLDRLAAALAPAGTRLWNTIRTPWKEGNR